MSRSPFATEGGGAAHDASRNPLAEGGFGARAQVNIAFVDDHPVVLEGVSSFFAADARYRVVAKGSSAFDARAIAATYCPEIILMDLSMPGEVYSVISDISHSSCSKVIVFTGLSGIDSAMKALDAGASGLVLKGATCGELLEAVASVLRGELFIARQYASQIMMGLRNRVQQKAADQIARLSVREKQIVDRLLQAQTNREIAAGLSISEKTVKRYMTALMLKLQARNRVEVVLHAQRTAALG